MADRLIAKYRRVNKKRRDAFLHDGNHMFHHKKTKDIRECPLCYERILSSGLYCEFCDIQFIDYSNYKKLGLSLDDAADLGFFITGK